MVLVGAEDLNGFYEPPHRCPGFCIGGTSKPSGIGPGPFRSPAGRHAGISGTLTPCYRVDDGRAQHQGASPPFRVIEGIGGVPAILPSRVAIGGSIAESRNASWPLRA